MSGFDPVNKPSTYIHRVCKQEREAVVMPLPVSMHAGQIFLLTKMLTGRDLQFYDFSTGLPVRTASKKH